MFECTARQREWPESIWALQIEGLLTGKGMVVYKNPRIRATNDCHIVKQAILRRWLVNAETQQAAILTGSQKCTEELYLFD